MPRLEPFRRLPALLVATMAMIAATVAPQAALAQVAATEDEAAIEAEFSTGGMQTIAVVGLSGYDAVIKDIGYLGALAGRPEGAQMIEGMISFFTQGKGLQGVDKSKPWGVVVQSDGMSVTPTICLPITDLDAILQIGAGFGLQTGDAGGGVLELSIPSSPAPLFAKQVGAWVFVSQTAESLDNAPADPSELLADLVSDYDLGARILAQNVPEMFKQLAIDGLRQGMKEGLVQGPDESDKQFAAREEMSEMQVEQLLAVIEQTDQVTLGIAVNEGGEKGLAIDFSMTALPESDLIGQLQMYQAAPSDYAGFAREDAAIFFLQSTLTPPDQIEAIIAQSKPQLDAAKNQIEQAIASADEVPNEEAREVLKSALDSAWESLEATIATGRTDMGGSLTLQQGEIGAMIGGAFAKPEKIEEALRKLEALAADEPDFPGVEWNASSHAGVAFHTMTIPITEPQAAAVLGDTIEVAIGIGEGMMCIGAGPSAVDMLSQAIDDSASSRGKEVPPFEMVLSLKQFMSFASLVAPPGEASVAMMATMFEDLSDEESQVSITLASIEDGVRYRIKAEEGVLQAIGTMANLAAQQAGAGGAPPF